ncbi:MAG TPA: hypothetical protein VM580_09035 [Labilithrix sp.]|jgi:hypothetical protein|nr:hypothetical protein [Labilithrix sp.]
MTSPEERIKELVRSQAIDGADAARLLEAVKPAGAGTVAGVRNPFERWSGEVTSLVGLGASLIGVGTSQLGARYDGALDLHFGARVPLAIGVLDQIVVWPLVALVFWLAARSLHRHVRAIDVLGVVGAARVPYALTGLLASFFVPFVPADPTKGFNLALVALSLVSLVGLGMHIFLLVGGFRTVSGARGGRLAGAFVVALAAAEVVTKFALWSLRSLFFA